MTPVKDWIGATIQPLRSTISFRTRFFTRACMQVVEREGLTLVMPHTAGGLFASRLAGKGAPQPSTAAEGGHVLYFSSHLSYSHSPLPT